MSEFDFDELDRAVNQVLTGDQPRPVSDPVASPVAPSASVSPSPTAAASPAPVAAANPVEAPAARRTSSGRFMDMVHPSSDMRGANDAAPAPQKPVQQAPAPKPAPWASDHHVATGPASIPEAPVKADPLLAPSTFAEEPRAMESPFLPDAKVEKRPLGGSASPDELGLEDAPSLSKSMEEALAEVSLVESEDDAPQAAPLEWPVVSTAPAEKLLEAPEEQDRLEDQDLLEQGGATPTAYDAQQKTLGDIPNPHEEEPLETDADEADVPDPTPVVAAPAPEPPEAGPSVHEEVAAPVVSAAVPAGPASITQQYTEQPSTTAQPGAIYDTESYHQPLAPKTKKRSGSWMVLWIILFAVAGAGIGTALYSYVLPLL